jgi:drug/metabolite transporter (DMT)-like permease
MSAAALLLVLAAALVHATWNLLAKRVSATTSAPAFVWLYGALSAALYTPAAAWVLAHDRPSLGMLELGLMAGSALVHLAYFLVLQRGYRDGDLSVVYPLARGSGPLLSSAAAVVLLGERPSALAVGGMLLVVLGVLLFAAPSGAARGATRPVMFGLGTGALIAVYTVWDKYAVATRGIAPLLMEWATSLARVLLLAPVAWRQRALVREAWGRHRGAALGVGALNPLSYLLVMVAMRTTPVAYLAPAREVSILAGAVMGARLLREGDVGRRVAAAGVMLLGVVALALG